MSETAVVKQLVLCKHVVQYNACMQPHPTTFHEGVTQFAICRGGAWGKLYIGVYNHAFAVCWRGGGGGGGGGVGSDGVWRVFGFFLVVCEDR